MEPDEIRALVRTVEDRAGPGVEMLPGTMRDVGDTQGVVLLDGTTQPVGVNVVAECEPGDRVMVLFVPPRGGFVVGRFVSDAPVSFRLVDELRFTTVGTATFDRSEYPWLKAVKVTAVGGGGNGGDAAATGVNQAAVGGGGGGGGTARSLITADDVPDSVTVTVGGANTASSFGSLVVGDEGDNGGNSAPLGSLPRGLGGGGAGGGGTGDVVITGGPGGVGLGFAINPVGGKGGDSAFGGGGQSLTSASTNGTAGSLYGGGGAGAQNDPSEATARTGGAGAQGIVIVELYA